ncbi:MAG: Na/Pi symporter [Sulfurimonadaceae bacterium]|nr:Na/Pi symporter [Sulfurimonadaceae bacterium]
MKNGVIVLLFALLGYLVLVSSDFKVIAAGVAIFMVGMVFLEDGFKRFAGGMLEEFLKRTTDTLMKAIFSGFFVTSIVQSSSLVAVIAISFLSAELIGLAQAIGIIFGSNIGTTTTAWIIAAFGVKVKIAYYAMPMIVFGVALRFFNGKTAQGFGPVLLGLGFVFLGIGYMKEGFDTLKEGIDLAQFAMPGLMGIMLYMLVGIVATVVIQSSSATMAIIITALATGQIVYINALALAIGANIGTTVTAIIGAMASNENGKRLALAHLIFNMVTASIAVIFLYQLAALVDTLAASFGIDDENYVLKLALFHTIFNLIGVLTVAPFTTQLVTFLKGRFGSKPLNKGRPKFLDASVIELPGPALAALAKETDRLYEKAIKALTHALLLRRHDVWSDRPIYEVVADSQQSVSVNVDDYYRETIKVLYGEILKYSVMAQSNMNDAEQNRVYQYKIACRNIVEALKHVKELNKNIVRNLKSANSYISAEYDGIRERLATLLREIEKVRKKPNDILAVTQIEVIRSEVRDMDRVINRRIDELVRNNQISTVMATSLMNDSAFASDIILNLVETATILWIEDEDIRNIELEQKEDGE